MPIGFFVAPYKLVGGRHRRYCAMVDAQSVIAADDGDWSETEYLGNRALVKVRASIATLADIASAPNIRRLPKDALDTSLSDLTGPQKTALRGELEDAGYMLVEIQERFGNDIGAFTLRDVVRFATQRRLKPRYDQATDTIFVDGPEQACRDIVDVDHLCFGDSDWGRLKTFRDDLIAQWMATQTVVRITQALPTLPKWERDAILVLCGQAGYFFDRIRPDTFPTTGILDAFTRTDEDPLGNGNWSGPVTSAVSQLKLITNAVTSNIAGSTYGDSYWSANPNFGPDSEVFATLATKTADGDEVDVFIRCNQPGNTTVDGYVAEMIPAAGTDSLTDYRLDNGAFTALGSPISQEWASGEKMGKDAIGTTLTIYRFADGSWSSLGTRDGSAYNVTGFIGLGMRNQTGRWDDFSGGNVSAGPHAVQADFSRFPKKIMRKMVH